MPAPDRNKLRFFWYPFSFLYGLVTFIRNLLYDHDLITSHAFPLPIISVGNLTVGGTGKTPHVEYLIGLLKDQCNVAVLSRGYKRKTRHFILAGTESGVRDIGDEPVQIKKKFPDVKVAVDRKRVNGVRQLLSRFPDLDVVLLDDAYQHRRIKPGLSILLMDYNRPVTQDRLLPAGRLRERIHQKRRADIILVTKCPDRLRPSERQLMVTDLKMNTSQRLYFTRLIYGEPVPVFRDSDREISASIKASSSPEILMVTGIASPRLFKRHLDSISNRIIEMIFPDHHAFRQRDVGKILRTFERMESENRYIFTTEKDAVRLRKFINIDLDIRNRMFYVPIKTAFLNDDADNFNNQILTYVNNNTRDSILHQKQN